MNNENNDSVIIDPYDLDVTDLDYSLANDVIGPAMNELVKLYEDAEWPKYPSTLNSVEEWKEILYEIQWTFNNYTNEPAISDYDFEILWNKIGKDGSGNTRVNVDVSNEDEYRRYVNDFNAHEERIKNGLSLFASHYQSLWI